MKGRSALAISLVAILSLLSIIPLIHTQVASAAGTMRNFYLATEYNFGGQGYNVFYPQTLVIEQGDQVNITVRNVGTESFQLNIEGQSSVAVQPGSQNAAGIQPADTAVPVFTPSAPGIYSISTDKFPEMNGQIVVLPTDPASYNPDTQTRSFTQLILADFAGDGYDKFFPAVMVVNQGDTVNVSMRNTDDMSHGFAIAAYDMNVGVNPGQDQPDGSIAPVTTTIQPFTASKAGIFRFLCTSPCGPGHFEMVGQLVVLPTGGAAYTPDITTMYTYMTVKPDFTGDGYDSYIPGNIFVNQGDFVYIEVRNTDVNAHGFSMPGYSIDNVTIAAAQSDSAPSTTYVPASGFFADQPGVFEYSCSFNCGPEPNQMIGYLAVLPTQSGTTTPPPQTTAGGIPFFLLLLISIAILIIGIIIGVIVAVKFK
jgi:heme/copper-type cytochrome/quinol oxidase subunit 2